MPLYEYSCDSCGKNFEIMQKMSDKPIDKCPTCGSTLHKVFSSEIGISFKGSGFYVNDSSPKKENSSK